MEKLKALFQSRKFWALVSSLVTIWGGYFIDGLNLLQAIQGTVLALSTYSLGVAIDSPKQLG